jgi:hypothetical protein
MKKSISILCTILIIAIIIVVTENAKAQSLTFSQVLLVNSSSTVPAGKVWKIESVVMPLGGTIKYSSSSGSGGCNCNGSSTNWTTFTTTYLPTTSLYCLVINGTNYLNLSLPVWIPAGTTIVAKGPLENCYTSAGCYNNVCPAAALSLTGIISVIEFNIVP